MDSFYLSGTNAKWLLNTCEQIASRYLPLNRSIDIHENMDLSMDLVVKALESCEALRVGGSNGQVVRFLQVTAPTKHIDLLRRARFRKTDELDVNFEEARKPDTSGTTEDKRQWVRSRLEGKDAVLWDVHTAAGLKRTKTARILGVSINTISNLWSKLRARIIATRKRFEESLTTIGAYRNELVRERHSRAKFVSIDVTGNAASFINWAEEPQFHDVLLACGQFRPAIRHFVVDENRLSANYVSNFRATVQRHLQNRIEVGVIVAGNQVPKEVTADIAVFGERAVDFGHLEYVGSKDQGTKCSYARAGSPDFRNILERLDWVMQENGKNVTFRIRSVDDLDAIVKELRRLVNLQHCK